MQKSTENRNHWYCIGLGVKGTHPHVLSCCSVFRFDPFFFIRVYEADCVIVTALVSVWGSLFGVICHLSLISCHLNAVYDSF